MVPFDKIGPGQSIRLAWQVMGKNGPIANPTGIRYLPPDGIGPASPVTDIGNLGTALAGVNLIVAGASLAISAQTLQEIRQVSRRVEDLIEGQFRIENAMEKALAGIHRIELGVSESRLARVVTNALRSAAREDGLDFEPFHQLSEDLQELLDDAGIARGRVTNLRLDLMFVPISRIAALLRGQTPSRQPLELASELRLRQSGDAIQLRTIGRAPTFRKHLARLQGVRAAVISNVSAMVAAHDVVEQRFSFDDSDDHAVLNERMCGEGIGFRLPISTAAKARLRGTAIFLQEPVCSTRLAR
ncbi:MAG: hypothetical protein R3A52_07175 [Polyangiales bacterium]